MKWHHTTSPICKARTVASAGKVTGTIYWDSEGGILVKFLSKQQTVNVGCHGQTLKKLLSVLYEMCPMEKLSSFNITAHDITLHMTLETPELG
jgi:hypothetical protein